MGIFKNDKKPDDVEIREHQKIRYCPNCKDKTVHNKCGFPEYNYREICNLCGSINYVQRGY